MPKFNKELSEITTHFEKWLYVLKHLNELDKPTVDVVSADGTFVRMVYLWPNVSQWPAEFNNRKWIL